MPTIAELLDDKLTHDRNNELRDIKSRHGPLKHLRPFFGDIKARDLSREPIEKYIERRRTELVTERGAKVEAENNFQEKRSLSPKVERSYPRNDRVKRGRVFDGFISAKCENSVFPVPPSCARGHIIGLSLTVFQPLRGATGRQSLGLRKAHHTDFSGMK